MPTTTQGIDGADIVRYARTQLGDPYEWGAEGPDSFDCSGLVEYVYKHFGLRTPRTTADMLAGRGGLQTITEQQLQAGDLILSKGWDPSKPDQGHVGIYTGDGRIIEAGDPVQVTTYGPQYKAHVTGYRRVPGIAGYGIGAGSGAGGGYTGGLPNPLDPAQVGGFIAGLATPKTVTEGLGAIGGGILSIGQSMANVGHVANVFGRALLPSNMLRAAMFFLGIVSLLIGIWFLASEAKDS